MRRIPELSLLVAATLALVGCDRAAPHDAGAGQRGAAAASARDAGLFCDEHGVPEKFCTLCHEELKSQLLLCREHGNIPEDICTLCHPEVESKLGLVMCEKGHKLPKHFCSECAKPSSS